jgi:photosystem II stability/assembly factor-like uncharacterized protein
MMRWLLFSLLWGLSVATSAAGLTDLLDLPAEPDERSLRSLLLDVTAAGDRLVAVGEYGTVLYSDDGGKGWRQAHVPVQVTLTSVHFPTPEKGWAVGHDAVILHSADGGETWSRQLDGRDTGDKLLASAEAWNTELESASADGMDSDELMVLQDAAMMAMDEALREQEIGPNRPFLDVWFADEQHGFAVGAFNYFFVTRDGGVTWEDGSSRLPNPEFLHLYSISPVADNTLLVVGEFGLVMRSRDAGVSWELLDLGYEGSLFSVNGDNGSAWIAGLRGNVFFSPDAGDSWQHVKPQTEASLLGSVITGDRRARFVGLGGTLMTVDLSGDPAIGLGKGSPLTLAALIENNDNDMVLVGEAGITRLDDSGDRASAHYLGGGQ